MQARGDSRPAIGVERVQIEVRGLAVDALELAHRGGGDDPRTAIGSRDVVDEVPEHAASSLEVTTGDPIRMHHATSSMPPSSCASDIKRRMRATSFAW